MTGSTIMECIRAIIRINIEEGESSMYLKLFVIDIDHFPLNTLVNGYVMIPLIEIECRQPKYWFYSMLCIKKNSNE